MEVGRFRLQLLLFHLLLPPLCQVNLVQLEILISPANVASQASECAEVGIAHDGRVNTHFPDEETDLEAEVFCLRPYSL